MRSPDGRVDPNQATIRALQAPTKTPPNQPSPSAGGNSPRRRTGQKDSRAPGETATPASRPSHQRRRGFVNPGVKETPQTTRILDAIDQPFAGVRAKVISAYLNDEELFWKVNYHWEYLLWMLEHAQTLPVEDKVKSELNSLAAGLRACAPDPNSGYRTSPVGKPKDRSTMDQMTKRHRVIRQTKRQFKALIARHDLKAKSKRTAKSFDYAVAPVAHPGTSKHGSGYALDISGDNNAIAAVCDRLGASLVFDEKSHVHVEFKHGVKVPR
jgi:hypothetical protein